VNIREHIYRLLRDHRWSILVTIGFLILLTIYQQFELKWNPPSGRWLDYLYTVLIYIIFAIMVFFVSKQIFGLISERNRLRSMLQEVEQQKIETRQILESLFQVSQQYVDASDEKEVIELVLRLSTDLVGAVGASFVPLDEHGQPLSAIVYGEQPNPILDDWLEYLATPAVRDRCDVCRRTGTLVSHTCPLISVPSAEEMSIYCLRLNRAGNNFGMLNLYIPDSTQLDPQTQSYLHAITDEASLALEGVRLRKRELAALQYIQSLREKSDLHGSLVELLGDVHQMLEADFSLLVMQQRDKLSSDIRLVKGDYPQKANDFLEGILQGVIRSGEPVLLGDVSGDPATVRGVWALLASPVSIDDQAMGVLLIGNHQLKSFQPRQLELVRTIAGQIAIMVQNYQTMDRLKYSTMLEERTRLARELHDGLAQSLGFLKLQLAQMRNFLDRGEMDRFEHALSVSYQSVSSAYLDAREAIDGLRIDPLKGDIFAWLRQISIEFQEAGGVPVQLDNIDTDCQLPPEVQMQLIRIVQEALSNIRKHASANSVEISFHRWDRFCTLSIQDNGIGFSAHEIPDYSQHGLRGMRERSELIGGDFQIISKPNQGTTVRVSIPLEVLELGLQPHE
jgi:two-component system nitrate/nitrite sensor histidine kinase NarX